MSLWTAGGRSVRPSISLTKSDVRGGVAAAGQGERAAVHQVGVVGIDLFGQTAGGDFEGEGGMALLEKEAGEAAEQFRPLRPDGIGLRRAAEGEQVEHRSVLLGKLFEDGGGGRNEHGESFLGDAGRRSNLLAQPTSSMSLAAINEYWALLDSNL